VDHDPFVLLLSGPSGSGKSTTAAAWAASRTTPAALIDMDLVRSFVRSGKARPDVAWDSEAERQWRLAMKQTGYLAKSYVERCSTALPANERRRTRIFTVKPYMNRSVATCSARSKSSRCPAAFPTDPCSNATCTLHANVHPAIRRASRFRRSAREATSSLAARRGL
jgi:hypothetical protein